MAIDLGEGTTITATFKDENGTETDPTTPVIIVVEDRAGAKVQDNATKESVGVFSYEYTPTTSGVHYFTFYSSDSPPAIEQGTFVVKNIVADKT